MADSTLGASLTIISAYPTGDSGLIVLLKPEILLDLAPKGRKTINIWI